MRTVVVGGAGYIGSVVTNLLLEEGHEVLVVDDCSTGHPDAVPPSADFVQADITDAASFLAGREIDAVLHFAAKSLVGESMVEPSLYWRTNVGSSVKDVLDAVEQVTGRPVPCTVGPRRAGDPARLVASADRAAQRLGWRAERTLIEMVSDAWDFHRAGTDGGTVG